MILRSTNVKEALRRRQRGFLLNPYRFGGAVGDPNWSDVQFAASWDSALTDESSHARTTAQSVGTAAVSATKVQYGAKSLRLNAQSVVVGVNTDWTWMHIAAAKWTWETWMTIDSFAHDNTLFSTSNGSTGNVGIWAGVLATTRAINVQMYRGTASTFVVNNSVGTFPNDTVSFHHVAIEWDHSPVSNNLQVFVDGVSAGFANRISSPNNSAATSPLKLGGYSTIADFTGYMDETRITQNVWRYNAGFTPAGPFLKF